MSPIRNLHTARDAARSRAVRLWLCATLVGLLVAFAGVPDAAFHILRAKLREHPASGQVVVVGIDDRSLAALGQWPLPRSTYATAIDRLFEAGAAEVYLSVNFPTSQDADEDRILARSLLRHPGRVFLSTRFTVDEATGGRTEQPPIPILARAAGLVNTNYRLDEGSILTHLPISVASGGHSISSLSARIAGLSESAGEFYPLDVTLDPSSIPVVSMVDVLRGASRSAFRGRHVIIGLTTDQVPDANMIRPYGRVANSVAHAVGAETLLGGTPRDLGWLPGLALASAFILLASAMSGAWRRTSSYVLLALAVPFVPALLPARFNLIVAPAFAAMLVAMVAAGVTAFRESLARRGTVNQVSGLLNLSALRQQAPQSAKRLIVAQIHNFADAIATLPENEEASLVAQVASRLQLGRQDVTLYHGDNGVFAWFADDDLDIVGDHLGGLYAMFRSPVIVGGTNIDLAVSFGVDSDGERTVANRLGSALVAATEAAAEGAKWREFDKSKLVDAAWKLSLLSQLDTAIDEGDLWVAYQPKLDLRDRRIVGAEALVRWTHPEKGAISPIEFVAAAEQHNRIEKLTMHVLDRAVLAAATINAHGIPFGIAVNLSTRLLENDDIVAGVARALAAHELPAEKLTLEITETATLSADTSLIVLGKLRDLGVRISIDDYGTGLSTLDYLKRIPASEIKIDRSFVQSILGNGSDLLMVNSTIQLAHSLGHIVVAEGVETDEVLARLVDLQCDIAQGYRIGRPMTFQDLARRLLAERRRAA